MRALLNVVLTILDMYTYVVIAGVIMSWLLAFNVVNFGNEFVRGLWRAINAMTEPFLRRIRGFMPNLGGLDLSPIILLLGVYFIQQVIVLYIYPNVF